MFSDVEEDDPRILGILNNYLVRIMTIKDICD